ncbi:MAG: PilZ domain-containing protein [Bacteriovoracaceae bacterium]|jgi:hypothetical protein|nr:hypothetical protein [Halobacteriovoraceae bacterium]MDP7321086.1 PilZ domain-containing protein [Bacteriovoracaceae bacterium]
MSPHLSLVQSDFKKLEKRTLPRFPFCFLIFKCSQNENHVFEVKDISFSGMQLALKSGEHNIKQNESITGNIHWQGKELEVRGHVKWSTPSRLGVEFSSQKEMRDSVARFLAIEEIAKIMKPVHELDYGVDIPTRLKYWLRADGPVELFIWQHNDNEFSQFQILMMEHFVEWEDGKGLKTARVVSKRDVDTPLINEDEIVFKIDEAIDDQKIKRAAQLIKNIPVTYVDPDIISFIQMKLGQ